MRLRGNRDEDPTTEERRAMRARQRAQFGGSVNWGTAFFGWLVAVGLAAILTAFLTAAGAAIGLTDRLDASASNGDPETVGIVGGSLLFVVLCLAYLAGGYVAGRMSRFDGARQGLGMWMFGLVIAGLLAVIGLLAGSADYNPLAQLDLPRIPVEEGALTSGGQIAMAAIVIGTFLAAIGGGIIGERYHRRVDEAGFEPATPKLSGRPKPAPPKAPAEAPLAR